MDCSFARAHLALPFLGPLCCLAVSGPAVGQEKQLAEKTYSVEQLFRASPEVRMQLDPVYADAVRSLQQARSTHKQVSETIKVPKCMLVPKVVRRGPFGCRRRVICVPMTVVEERVVTREVVEAYVLRSQAAAAGNTAIGYRTVDYTHLPVPLEAIAERIRARLTTLNSDRGLSVAVQPRGANTSLAADDEVLAEPTDTSAPVPRDEDDAAFKEKYKEFKVEYALDLKIDRSRESRIVHIKATAYGLADATGSPAAAVDAQAVANEFADVVYDSIE